MDEKLAIIINQPILSSFANGYLLKDILEFALDELNQHYKGVDYILYGSYARLEPSIDSDIDIAILGKDIKEPEKLEFGLSDITADFLEKHGLIRIHPVIYDIKNDCESIERNILNKPHFKIERGNDGSDIQLCNCKTQAI